MDYKRIDAKVGSDNGLDGFYVKTNANGQVTEIASVECKQLHTSTNAGGNTVSNGVQLSKENLATGLPKQFSDDWFGHLENRLRPVGKIEAADLIKNNISNPNIFKRYIIGVDKAATNNPINILKLEAFN